MITVAQRAPYLPAVDRPRITWPGDARIAVWVAPNIEHYELTPPATSAGRDPWPRMPHPDVQQYAYKDYGNRVGTWRFADACDDYGVRCTVSLNMAVMDHFPEIRDLIVERGWDVMSHGIYNTRYSYELSPEEEAAWLDDTIASLRRHTGRTLRGMLGPSISATERTPDLMAERGLVYHADWVHDDVPVPLRTETGRLCSVPYSIELNDVPLFAAHHDGAYFEQICRRQFDRLYAEGGKVMCLALHPYLIAQPHMIGHLRAVLRYVTGHDGVWMATADEIATHYLDHHHDADVAHARDLAAVTKGA
jgi:peptidoglycan/xylan/chitin deacetylase (PgdA/CDA1 family)